MLRQVLIGYKKNRPERLRKKFLRSAAALERQSMFCQFKNGQDEEYDQKNSDYPPNDHSAVHHNDLLLKRVRQTLPKLLACAVDARSTTAFRATQYGSDLVVRQQTS